MEKERVVRVALDIRMLNHSGIGTMLRGLLCGFESLNDAPDFIFIGPENFISEIPPKLLRKFLILNTSIYGIDSQLFYPHQIDTDLLHYPHYNFPIKFKGKLIINVHDLAHYHFPTSPIHKYYISFFLNKLKKRNIQTITGTNFIKNELIEIFKLEEEKIEVVPHSVDLNFFTRPSKEDVEKFKKQYRLPENYILAIGINKPHKNIEFLIRVLGRKEFAEAPFVYCGSQRGKRKNLEVLVARLGIESRVIFLDQISLKEIKYLYAGAEIFVFPSIYEGFGLPPLEAMAIGVPVVSSNSKPLPEVLDDTPLFFDPKSEDSCAEAIIKVLDSSSLKKELANKGYNHIKKFSWKSSAEKTLNVYKRVS